MIPILTYHSVATGASGPISPFTVTPETFRRHLDLIADLGVHVLSWDELVDHQLLSRPVPYRSAVVTFDDGFADNLRAFEVLSQRRTPATLFVATGLLRDSGEEVTRLGTMLDAAGVREAEQLGIHVASHGHRHLELDACRRLDARLDIVTGKDQLEGILGHSVDDFAYPYGYQSPATRRMIRESGFRSAAAVGNRLATCDDSIFALSRLLVRSDTPLPRLRGWLLAQSAARSSRDRTAAKVWRAARVGRGYWSDHRRLAPRDHARG